MIEHLVTKGTIDEDILLSLEKKDDMQEAMIAAVKVRIGGGKDEGRSDV